MYLSHLLFPELLPEITPPVMAAVIKPGEPQLQFPHELGKTAPYDSIIGNLPRRQQPIITIKGFKAGSHLFIREFVLRTGSDQKVDVIAGREISVFPLTILIMDVPISHTSHIHIFLFPTIHVFPIPIPIFYKRIVKFFRSRDRNRCSQ